MSIYRSLGKYLGIFLLFYVLMSANIAGLHPFAFGMFFALVWCNQKIYILAPLYILSGILVFGTVEHIIIDAITVGVFLVAFFLHYRFRKPLNRVLIGCYAFLSQFGAIYFASGVPESLWQAVVSLIFGLVCMHCYLNILQNMLLKGVRRKYCIDEIICWGVALFALGAGLWCLPFSEYYFFGLISLCMLICASIFGAVNSVVVAIFMGLGVAFASGNYLLLSHLIFVGLFAAVCQTNQRIWAGLAVILIDVVSGLYFLNDYNLIHFVGVAAAAFVYILIPKRLLKSAKMAVLTDKEDFAVRALINRNRQALRNRLYDLGQVFDDLGNVFLRMVSSKGDFEDNVAVLGEQVRRQNCANCPKRKDCARFNTSISDGINSLIVFAYERGKVSLIDVSPVLTSNCTRISIILNYINMLVAEYKSNMQNINNLNSGRRILSEQMTGISDIISALATEMSVSVSFDTELEANLREQLMYAGIQCSEVIFYQQGNTICRATLVIKTRDVSNPDLLIVMGRVLGVKMEVDSISSETKPTYSIVCCKNVSAFDLIFGVAAMPKSIGQKSGDTHSVLKLGNDKVLLSLCDGMGSGECANNTSTLALNMIESFYRAGFDSNLILRSANQLLSLTGEESFSAVDICVIDMHTGTCEMIKVGSPSSFIKNNEQITELESSALPLGILEELKPSVRTLVLKDNDMIVLATDGIIDSFGSVEEIKTSLAQMDTQNPQDVAKRLLDIALKNYRNYPQDDMTVLVGKLFTKL